MNVTHIWNLLQFVNKVENSEELSTSGSKTYGVVTGNTRSKIEVGFVCMVAFSK